LPQAFRLAHSNREKLRTKFEVLSIHSMNVRFPNDGADHMPHTLSLGVKTLQSERGSFPGPVPNCRTFLDALSWLHRGDVEDFFDRPGKKDGWSLWFLRRVEKQEQPESLLGSSFMTIT